jgi:hypothetical protein
MIMKIDEPEAMREIHDIRRKLYEETKDMSPRDITAYIKAKAAEHEKRSGIKLPKLANSPK